MSGLQEILDRHAGRPGTLLAALQQIQEAEGLISEQALSLVAKTYKISGDEVRGVIEFYHELRTTPPGRHRVHVCRGDSCAANGASGLARAVESCLGIGPGTTTPDRRFSYDSVFCLGTCALSPSVVIDGEVHACLTPEDVVARLREMEHD